MAVVCCSKCRPGSVELKPTSRGVMPVCVGCEEKRSQRYAVEELAFRVAAKRKPKKKAKR